MAQRISRSGPHLRLTKDTLWLSSKCPVQARRQFSAYQRLNAKPLASARKQQLPSRPSLSTSQSMQMKNMRKEDLPEEMGMLRITYILPQGPSFLSNPKLRASQLYEFSKQYGQEILQSIFTKCTFWRKVPKTARPKHLKKSWILPFRPPQIPLQTFSHARIIKDLHKRSYEAIQIAAETGDMKGIRETCGKGLQDHYARLVHNYSMKRELVKWEVKYAPQPFGVRILSHKFGQVPFDFGGFPLGQQQVVARISSTQTLTPGTIVGKLKDGQPDIQWGEPKTRKMTEHVIMARKYVVGKFEPWKIFGFQSPKGTQEELDHWREAQLSVPTQPGQRKASVAAA